MKAQLLIGASITTLTLVAFFFAQSGHLQISTSEPKQTRDFLQLCIIKSCYSFFTSCSTSSDCSSEMSQLNTSILADYTQYDALVSQIQHNDLKALLQCQNECGNQEYLKDCGSEINYISQCPQNEECVKENQDYFDNANDCSERKYNACNGLEGDVYQMCFLSELVYCFSDGISGSNTRYENALLCV